MVLSTNSHGIPNCDRWGRRFWQPHCSAPNLEAVEVNGYEIGPGAFLIGVDFFKVSLAGADLQGANLVDANFGWADLEGAYLSGANLDGADLTGANLSGANLDGASLAGTDLDGAKCNAVTVWPDGFDPEITGVIFE